MKNKLAFFGASVTAQKTGYASFFSEILYTKYIYGYGGSHLHSAGICTLDQVLATDIDFCFIEWFTPKLNYTNQKLKEYVDLLIAKCLKKSITPIFLFFPKKDSESDLWEKKLEQYNFIVAILNKYNVPYIEVYKYVKEPLDVVLRDIVHTTDKGAEIYFQIIEKQFKKIQNEKLDIQPPSDVKFSDIKSLVINKTIKNLITFEGSAEIISIHQDVGPFSNKINLISDGQVKPYSLIDPDCYYVRSTFALSGRFKNKFTVELLNTEKPKKLYKKEINWENLKKEQACLPETNEMRFKTVYFLGKINAVYIDGNKI